MRVLTKVLASADTLSEMGVLFAIMFLACCGAYAFGAPSGVAIAPSLLLVAVMFVASVLER
ncbi:MAG TPA: hypothetical protein VFJ50_01905 [Gemmatimonadales bacterium]|nr:hypothetical protein [Gemmatimonadales bacterium]